VTQPDDDLRRRLTDLAESAGPWADPLPTVMRRAHAQRRRVGLPRIPVLRWSLAVAAAALIVGAVLVLRMSEHGAGSHEAVPDGSSFPSLDSAHQIQSGGSTCPGGSPIPEASTAAVVTVRVDARRTLPHGGPVTARLTVSSAPSVTLRVTPRLLAIQGNRVVADIALSPTTSTTLPGAPATFDASGLLTCTFDGAVAPRGKYQLLATVITHAPPPFAPSETVLSVPVPIEVE
jgi:hypothetical protein